MTENDFILLLQLYSHRHLTDDEICLELNITKSQYQYKIGKLNEWLIQCDLDRIDRVEGKLIFSYQLSEYIEKLDFTKLPISHLDQETRLVLLFIIIIASGENLSLTHLSQYLEVSKNTVLLDLKTIKTELSNFDLELKYQRSSGYEILGSSFNIRRFAEFCINNLSNTFSLIKALEAIDKNIDKLLDSYHNLIIHIETELGIRYSDKTLETSVLYFYIVDKMPNSSVSEYSEIQNEVKNSDEYDLLRKIISLYFVNPVDQENLAYLALYFLSINKVDRNVNVDSIKRKDLMDAVTEMIYQFENLSALKISDKAKLIEKLATHLGAAFYRYKYSVRSPYEINFSEQMQDDLNEIYYFISRSVYPIELLLGMELPDKEIFFIASFIGGHLRLEEDKNSNVLKEVKAIVLCENGIVYSNILMNGLKKLFPEIHFESVMSFREFKSKEIELSKIDIVFSSKYISTEHELVVVNSIDFYNKDRIIKEVEKKLRSKGIYGNGLINEIISRLPEEINQDTSDKIRKELHDILGLQMTTNAINAANLGLGQNITEQNIAFDVMSTNWNEVLLNACKDLINLDLVDKTDLELLMDTYPEPSLEILFGSSILVPHIRVEGNQNFHYRLCILKNPIVIEGRNIRLVFVLFAAANENHVTTVYDLHNLSMSENVELLENAISKKEVIKVITDTVKD